MTTLFIGKFLWGRIEASDDIESLHWVQPKDINVDRDIMVEHRDLYANLCVYMDENKILEEANVKYDNSIACVIKS
jgi:hypothetical protein